MTNTSAVREQTDAERYQQLLDDPETGRHLLLLLSQGRGDQAAFRRMQDRIAASKLQARAEGVRP
jgi:hypothetical protein